MPTTATLPAPRPEVRDAVRQLLTRSDAFRQLTPEAQKSIAQSTALIADYLAAPEGIPGNRIAGGIGMPAASRLPPPPSSAMAGPSIMPAIRSGPSQASYRQAAEEVGKVGQDRFSADAAREGAAVAGEFMRQVSFTQFVSGLIEGVFSSIVRSSIQQMEAYQKMIAAVAQSLQQFRDDNVTPNQGRDHMVDKFPDLFEIGTDDMEDDPQPRLRLREGIDEGAALARVNGQLSFEDGKLQSLDLSDSNTELAIVTAARTQLARQRQQLMASLVLMGINRIVVTDGKLSAKIMYDFQASGKRKLARSAAAYDYARDASGNLSTVRHGEDPDNSVDSIAKGSYQYEERPVMTAKTTATDASENTLQARANLSGAVEVNFKSDYLPLEKMATPGMIAAIQGNSTPVDPNIVPSVAHPAAPAPAAATAPAAQA